MHLLIEYINKCIYYMSFTKDVIEKTKETTTEDVRKELFKDTFDVSKAIEAQTKLCNERRWPFFAPRNGRCWRCGKQIFDKISVYEASKSLITGCPLCHHSYVD